MYPNPSNCSERSDLAILMPKNNSEFPKSDRFARCKSVPDSDLPCAVKPTLRRGNRAMFMARVTEGAKVRGVALQEWQKNVGNGLLNLLSSLK